LRQVLVSSQFAISTPLLIAAGLLLASLNQLARVDLGFDTGNLAGGSISLPAAQYSGSAPVVTFWEELQRRVEALPGVVGVAFADGRPPNEVGNFNNFDLEDFPTAAGHSQPVTPWVEVSPGYFRLLGLKLLEGRLLDERDGLSNYIETVVVDRAWAKRFFPSGSALGKRFKEGGCTQCPWTTVVGVVSDVKYAGLDKPNEGSVYTAMPGRGSESPTRFRYILVRTSNDAAAVLPALRQTIRQLDPTLPFSNVATMDDLVEQALNRPRSLSSLVGGFAVVALLLSIIGIYGVMAYYVQQHAKDISIRLALGAGPYEVLRMVVGQGMTIVGSGVAFGLLTAFALTRLMSTLLFGIGARDALTFGSVTILLLSIALIACWVPGRRAVAVEPASVLRND
jgi:putative ABC transport system permease protein